MRLAVNKKLHARLQEAIITITIIIMITMTRTILKK